MHRNGKTKNKYTTTKGSHNVHGRLVDVWQCSVRSLRVIQYSQHSPAIPCALLAPVGSSSMLSLLWQTLAQIWGAVNGAHQQVHTISEKVLHLLFPGPCLTKKNYVKHKDAQLVITDQNAFRLSHISCTQQKQLIN